ncbi:hypothetical protein B9J08_03382 [Candidozyma auris]|uniref:R3H domain-containing protein n=1 Tax=Candidozyma auris TaxID=498019 RepID=A0A2H1A108_CANAR|nr:hypothetical protein B9J08_001132 [[Candida] auris]
MTLVKEREKQERPPSLDEGSSSVPNSDSLISSVSSTATPSSDNEEGEASDDQSDSDGFSTSEAPEGDSESEPEDQEVERLDESLASTIAQEIDEGTYICLVCTCEIDRHSKVWNCRYCYRVYDLDCIRDWAQRGSSTTEARTWRCPACSFEQKKLPSSFTCWCGRISNPKADSLIPFSCGNPCNKKYPHCVHSCYSVCHPGKHPECGAMGPVMNCKCGKHKQQLPCMVTPYKAGWHCEDPCETVVCMLGHKCSKGQCHSGFCGRCMAHLETSCYCGQHTMKIKCKDFDPKESYKDEERFIGGTRCESITIQYYDCNEHFEELHCQPLPKEKPHCNFKCSQPVQVSCLCGRIAKEVPCGASSGKQSSIWTLLECTEDCSRAKREEELRQIFNISPKGFENPYSEPILNVFKRQTNWCQKMESIMRDFISDYQDLVAAGSPAKRTYHFPPMSKPQRDFIKELAITYKLYAESQDREPHRFVFVVITDRTETPAMTILQALEKEREIELKRLQLEELKLNKLDEQPCNALLIRDTFFGVNESSVMKAVSEILNSYEEYEDFGIKCMKESAFVFHAPYLSEMDKEKEDKLYMLSKKFKSILREKLIAFDCKMCLVDEDITEILKVDTNNVMTNSSNASVHYVLEAGENEHQKNELETNELEKNNLEKTNSFEILQSS